MIFDKLHNSRLYENISPLMKKAFTFLKETDLNKLEPGKHIIDGDDLFAIVMEYDTKDAAGGLLEAHRRYIDVQYMVSGKELMGVAQLSAQVPEKEYDEKDDYVLFKDDMSFVKVESGQFTVFFPNDLHLPCIKVNEAEKVRKVVVKVRV